LKLARGAYCRSGEAAPVTVQVAGPLPHLTSSRTRMRQR
jgi:hypothetical protein